MNVIATYLISDTKWMIKEKSSGIYIITKNDSTDNFEYYSLELAYQEILSNYEVD